MTPLQFSNNISKLLNINLFIKRDDLYPISGGGSKARKLDIIIPKALQDGKNAVVTTGSSQSNHIRATALFASRLGWRSIFVVHDNEPKTYLGNLKIAGLTGAELRFVKKDLVKEAMDEAMLDLVDQEFNPLYIWGGGHCVEGSFAFYLAVEELKVQLGEIRPDYVIVASGTGTTQAGIECGIQKHYPGCKVLGVSIARKNEPGVKSILSSIDELKQYLSISVENDSSIFFDDSKMGEGYEDRFPELTETIKWAASVDGLILDPTYTGKAFYALRSYVDEGLIPLQSNVVFWHTGGLLNLMADTSIL